MYDCYLGLFIRLNATATSNFSKLGQCWDPFLLLEEFYNTKETYFLSAQMKRKPPRLNSRLQPILKKEG